MPSGSLQHWWTRFSQGGLPAVTEALERRRRRWAEETQPRLWARLGPAALWLGRRGPMRQPPVVVLSLPRSGSSWVGSQLGGAPDAAYLREPLTQSYLAAGGNITLLEFPLSQAPPAYQQAIELAFNGVPDFPIGQKIVANPFQWRLHERSRRRLVIKEVNPYLSEWFIARYRPRIIFLLRHPAAVALSFLKLGWVPDQRLEPLGRRLATALNAAWQQLRGYPDAYMVTYETLCLEPEKTFRDLYGFAGLTWNSGEADRLQRHTSRNEGVLSRDSRSMARNWVGRLAPAELDALRKGYLTTPLPWYQRPEDWQ